MRSKTRACCTSRNGRRACRPAQARTSSRPRSNQPTPRRSLLRLRIFPDSDAPPERRCRSTKANATRLTLALLVVIVVECFPAHCSAFHVLLEKHHHLYV